MLLLHYLDAAATRIFGFFAVFPMPQIDYHTQCNLFLLPYGNAELWQMSNIYYLENLI